MLLLTDEARILAGTILGWIGFATSFSMLLPQVVKVCVTKNTKSLSPIMFFLTFLNACIWTCYAFFTKETPDLQVGCANLAAMAASLFILIFIISNKIKDKVTLNRLKKDKKINENLEEMSVVEIQNENELLSEEIISMQKEIEKLEENVEELEEQVEELEEQVEILEEKIEE
ncbi:PQ-loop repeat-containing protein [Spiroplasma endosymbiont of Diplazon laetatorius]|uniref:SemiSWEET family sugar transporter n=1 Tax=Spiroplasma endosymbiont of Diplazon laetatorius TaxID=3066322 RepID=UPI0030CF200F